VLEDEGQLFRGGCGQLILPQDRWTEVSSHLMLFEKSIVWFDHKGVLFS